MVFRVSMEDRVHNCSVGGAAVVEKYIYLILSHPEYPRGVQGHLIVARALRWARLYSGLEHQVSFGV